MSIAVTLFKWLQGARFYQRLHTEALELISFKKNGDWWDIGCGPGLLTRLAATKGFQATGFDLNEAMVHAARRLALEGASTARFACADVRQMPPASADVVSASSLLAVLPDKYAALTSLWALVKPGGYLLIIEPGKAMNFRRALHTLVTKKVDTHRPGALLLWAFTRQGRQITDELNTWRPSDLDSAHRHAAVAHMVEIWVYKKKAA